MNFMINSLIKKFINNNLKALVKIQKLCEKNGFTYYSEVEAYLNRGRNQVSSILGKLEADNLIQRDKKNRPQKIYITKTGEKLLKHILTELT